MAQKQKIKEKLKRIEYR